MKTLLLLGLCLSLLVGCTTINQPPQNDNNPVVKPEPQPEPEPKPAPDPAPEPEPEPVVVDSKPIPYEVVGSTDLVKVIARQMMNHVERIDVSSFNATVDEILYSASEASTQNPILLYPATGFISNEEPNILQISYYQDQETLEEKRAEVWEFVTQLVKPIDYQTMSTYQKSKWVYETVINLTQYDYDSFYDLSSENPTITEQDFDAHSAYGSLIKNLAVCEGYANAYTILGRAIGLEVMTVNGTILSSGDMHAWNRTNFDGDWVITDPTFGDMGLVDYSYLNRSQSVLIDRQESMYGNRADLKTWPSLSDDYRYAKQEGLIYTTKEAQNIILEELTTKPDFIYLEITDYDEEQFSQWLIENHIHDTYSAFFSGLDAVILSK